MKLVFGVFKLDTQPIGATEVQQLKLMNHLMVTKLEGQFRNSKLKESNFVVFNLKRPHEDFNKLSSFRSLRGIDGQTILLTHLINLCLKFFFCFFERV